SSSEHANIAGDVLNATASSYNTAGTIGARINSAGSAGDPWSTQIPGAYPAGSAGYIVGNNIDAQVSPPLASASYVAPPPGSQVATAAWTDATTSDFNVSGSAGAKLFSGSGGGGATAAQIATAVLTDTTAGDLNVPGSIGYLIAQNLDAKVSSRSTYAGG